MYFLKYSLKSKGTFALAQHPLFSRRESRSCPKFSIVHVTLVQVTITGFFYYFLRITVTLRNISFIAARKKMFY